MRVVFWRYGGRAPANAHRNYRPILPPPTRPGMNTFPAAGVGLLPINFSNHLRFGFEPVVKIVAILSAAEFVKLVGSLPDFLLNLLRRLCRSSFSAQTALFHFRVPPSP